MPNSPIQPDAATLPLSNSVHNARFVAVGPSITVGQGATFGIKFVGIPGRITNGGISSRVIRVGVASP